MRLTKEQANIIGAYTGFLVGPFDELHEYVEQVMGRPVFTHEMGTEAFLAELRHAVSPELWRIARERDE